MLQIRAVGVAYFTPEQVAQFSPVYSHGVLNHRSLMSITLSHTLMRWRLGILLEIALLKGMLHVTITGRNQEARHGRSG
jgi:hypothetical protein